MDTITHSALSVYKVSTQEYLTSAGICFIYHCVDDDLII